MKLLLLFFLLLISFQTKSQASKKHKIHLNLKYCAYEPNNTLGLDTLLLLDGFNLEHLEQQQSKKKLVFFDYQVSQKGNCTHYKIGINNKAQHYFYVNQYTYDTLFLNIHKDSSIHLNKLSANYYTKIPSESFLLDDIKAGDKISFAYNYFDCPQYSPLYQITFKAINSKQVVILNPKKCLRQKSSILKIKDLLLFEKKIHQLEKGDRLEIQIRKNKSYQVFKCYLKDATQLPSFLKNASNNWKSN